MSALSLDNTTYVTADCAVFFKTQERWGEFSNMRGGFPLAIPGLPEGSPVIRTSEALYQAMRFPHLPEVQREILNERSPMGAKFASRRHLGETRADWDDVRVQAMAYALSVKLDQHFDAFVALFDATGDRPIVERSRKDPFWGAFLHENGETLHGQNILGQLLMRFREDIRRDGRGFRKFVAPMYSHLLGVVIPEGLESVFD